VGTREDIMAYLTQAGELSDPNGMASTQLAAAVGYPGSSVAFAQLLSGMERSGLIEREVRGKRTYRIGLGPDPSVRITAGNGRPAQVTAGATGVEGLAMVGFDYDELARRLLVQVVRHISESEDRGGGTELAQENVRLREQLRDAQRSLAQVAERVRRLPVTADLASNEVVLLQRLLSPWVRA
jgi:hypothetical protein